MRVAKQVPPVQRTVLKCKEAYKPEHICQRKSIQGSEVSAFLLSDIANDPSIVFEEGELFGSDPTVVFDIEEPTPPIEMCDLYCGQKMCDVYCIDAKERIIHGHIYADIPTRTTQGGRSIGTEGKIIHGHIYGDVEKE